MRSYGFNYDSNGFRLRHKGDRIRHHLNPRARLVGLLSDVAFPGFRTGLAAEELQQVAGDVADFVTLGDPIFNVGEHGFDHLMAGGDRVGIVKEGAIALRK